MALSATGAVVLLLSGGTPTSGEPPAVGPTFTYARTWNLLELQRHIAAGEVVAITTAPAGGDRTSTAGSAADTPAAGSQLLARTSDGKVVHVLLRVDAGSAVAALAGMGFGDLLTEEAWSSVRTARTADRAGNPGGSSPTSGAPPDPLRSLATGAITVLAIGLVAYFVLRLVGRSGGGGRPAGPSFPTIMASDRAARGRRIGRARPDTGSESGTGAIPDSTTVRLADVAGCDEAKLELTETIEFLIAPQRFHRLGGRIPRGILLYGPPGTGKTMLARAVAAEAGVPFHYTAGSEFVEKYVGVGAKRIRDLFAQARKLGRGVIFFDEFDAIGKTRGGPNSHEEREQTLNQLLVELDGFGTTEDVIVIAATNRLDVLDPALLRPGRFSRKIHVGLPDVIGRRAILDVHARDKPLSVLADLEAVARKTYGFSGAQLADLLNEAAILAARRGGEAIGPDDLHAGWLKVAVGAPRRRSMDDRERAIIAAHELGHAICGKVHGDRRRVEEISLFAHGEALGVTVSSQEDNDLPAESDLRARLVALMGGRAAEELLFTEITGGASNDFEKANQIATSMVTVWGMGRDPDADASGPSGRGSLSFLVARPDGTLPTDVQAAATRAVRAILDDAYAEACRTLVGHLGTLRRLAAYLVEHERIDGATFDALFDGRLATPPDAGEWRPESARPRAWTEIAAFASARGAPEVPRIGLARVAEPRPGVAWNPARPGEPTVSARQGVEGPEAAGRPAIGTPPHARRPGWPARGRGQPHGSPARRPLRGIVAHHLHRAGRWLDTAGSDRHLS